MVITHDEVREVGEGLLGLGAAGEGLVFERDVSAVLPAREGDVLNERLLATRLAGAEIERAVLAMGCLLYTSPSPRDATLSRMPSSA